MSSKKSLCKNSYYFANNLSKMIKLGDDEDSSDTNSLLDPEYCQCKNTVMDKVEILAVRVIMQ